MISVMFWIGLLVAFGSLFAGSIVAISGASRKGFADYRELHSPKLRVIPKWRLALFGISYSMLSSFSFPISCLIAVRNAPAFLDEYKRSNVKLSEVYKSKQFGSSMLNWSRIMRGPTGFALYGLFAIVWVSAAHFLSLNQLPVKIWTICLSLSWLLMLLLFSVPGNSFVSSRRIGSRRPLLSILSSALTFCIVIPLSVSQSLAAVGLVQPTLDGLRESIFHIMSIREIAWQGIKPFMLDVSSNPAGVIQVSAGIMLYLLIIKEVGIGAFKKISDQELELMAGEALSFGDLELAEFALSAQVEDLPTSNRLRVILSLMGGDFAEAKLVFDRKLDGAEYIKFFWLVGMFKVWHFPKQAIDGFIDDLIVDGASEENSTTVLFYLGGEITSRNMNGFDRLMAHAGNQEWTSFLLVAHIFRGEAHGIISAGQVFNSSCSLSPSTRLFAEALLWFGLIKGGHEDSIRDFPRETVTRLRSALLVTHSVRGLLLLYGACHVLRVLGQKLEHSCVIEVERIGGELEGQIELYEHGRTLMVHVRDFAKGMVIG